MSETEELASRDSMPTDSVLEIELALERGEVTFPMVVKALGLQGRPIPEWFGERYRKVYPPALAQFMARHCGINESFYANEFIAGALLTGKDELFFVILGWDQFNFDTIPARALEADINDLRLKAKLYLADCDARLCHQRLFRLCTGLIASLRLAYLRWPVENQKERGTEPDQKLMADLNELRRELEGVQETYRRVGLERGQWLYVGGAAIGTTMTVVLMGVAAILGQHIPLWVYVVAGGAAGALLSVLQRLTRGALRIRFESERLLRSGLSRPLVGVLSGLALFVLVKGNIVLSFVSTNSTNEALFFTGVAFLAGFSERFAQDVFGSAMSSLTKPDDGPQGASEKSTST